jgi:WD40 repeat protein
MSRCALAVLVGLACLPAGRAGEGIPLPPGAVARLGDARYRHAEGEAAALSRDGRLLALSALTSVSVWDLTSGRPLYRVSSSPEHDDGRYLPTEFTPDGKHLLVVDGSGRVRVCDAATGKPVRTVSPPEPKALPALRAKKEYRGRVTDLYGCPGGSRFLVRCDARYLFLLDLADWSLTYCGEERKNIMATSGDGSLLVRRTGLKAQVQDIRAGKSVLSWEVPPGEAHAALSPDGRLVAGATRFHIKLWDLKTKAEIKLAKPTLSYSSPVFTPDGKVLLANGWDDVPCVARWDTATGKQLPNLPANHGGLRSLAVSGDGKVLATTGADRIIRRFNLTTGKQLPVPEGFTGPVAAALSADGRWAAVGDRAGLLRVWAAPFSGSPRTLRRAGQAVDDLVFVANGRTLFAAYADRSVGIWDLATGRQTKTLRPPAGFEKMNPLYPFSETQLAVAPDKHRVVCSVSHVGVWAWDVRTGRVLWKRRPNAEEILPVYCKPVFTPDRAEVLVNSGPVVTLGKGDLGATRSAPGVVRLNPGTGQELGRLPVARSEDFAVARLTVSSNGRWLAASTFSFSDNGLVLLDRATGRVRWQVGVPHRQGAIGGLGFTPSGRWLLSMHMDGRIRVWETLTGKLAFELAGPPVAGSFPGLQLSADGRLAVSDGPGAVALVWSLVPRSSSGR